MTRCSISQNSSILPSGKLLDEDLDEYLDEDEELLSDDLEELLSARGFGTDAIPNTLPRHIGHVLDFDNHLVIHE